MQWQQVAQGEMSEMGNLGDYEDRLEEHDKCKLQLNLRAPVPSNIAGQLHTQLRNLGVSESQVSSEGNTLSVTFRKGFPWLAVIVAAILSIIVLAILIVAWQLFREVGQPTSTLIVVGAIVGMVLLSYIVYKIKF